MRFMSRTFKTVDYEKALDLTVSLRDVLPVGHLARFIVLLLRISILLPSTPAMHPVAGKRMRRRFCWACCCTVMRQAFSVPARWSGRPMDSAAFRFIAGGLHPDHDTLATFRKTFLVELQSVFV